MTATGYCQHSECFSIFVKHYDRLESDCVTDEDGRELGPGERVFVAIEPIALCAEHAGTRREIP
jgi:hypothetical protein